jgi:hypothetical protein
MYIQTNGEEQSPVMLLATETEVQPVNPDDKIADANLEDTTETEVLGPFPSAPNLTSKLLQYVDDTPANSLHHY